MYVFCCLLANNSGKTAPGFSHGACTHEFSENEEQKSSSLVVFPLESDHVQRIYAHGSSEGDFIMFNVTVQWRMIINDPFNSPTNMNALEIAGNLNH